MGPLIKKPCPMFYIKVSSWEVQQMIRRLIDKKLDHANISFVAILTLVTKEKIGYCHVFFHPKLVPEREILYFLAVPIEYMEIVEGQIFKIERVALCKKKQKGYYVIRSASRQTSFG